METFRSELRGTVPVTSLGERACLVGGLGRMPMKYLMGLALAHAGKLEKFGA